MMDVHNISLVFHDVLDVYLYACEHPPLSLYRSTLNLSVGSVAFHAFFFYS